MLCKSFLFSTFVYLFPSVPPVSLFSNYWRPLRTFPRHRGGGYCWGFFACFLIYTRLRPVNYRTGKIKWDLWNDYQKVFAGTIKNLPIWKFWMTSLNKVKWFSYPLAAPRPVGIPCTDMTLDPLFSKAMFISWVKIGFRNKIMKLNENIVLCGCSVQFFFDTG